MTENRAYQVGQRVWVYNVNARKGAGPVEGTVVKVGRKLVTVKAEYEKVFRIEDGRANDNYGHEWIKTEEQRAEDDHRHALVQRLHDAGVQFKWSAKVSTSRLEGFVKVLDDIA